MAVTPTSIVLELELSTGVWTDVSIDVNANVRARYGIDGGGPLDRLASRGICQFSLKNHSGNSGGLEGYYSPNHANARSGFTFGIGVRLVITYSAVSYVKWRGKLRVIDPIAGQVSRRLTRCVATDWIEELSEFLVRDIGAQIDQRSDQLIQAIIDSMPATAQPVSTDLDVGRDVYPYSLYDLGGGVLGRRVAQKIVQSELGFLAVIGDTTNGGVLRFENRHARILKASSVTFSNDMQGLSVPTNLDGAFNRIRVVIHPKRLDPAATTVLFAIPVVPDEVRTFVGPSEVRTFWGSYIDPQNEDKLIGGTEFVDPVVVTTDFTMNALQDGTGLDMTGDFTVVASFFASAVKFVVTNTSATFGGYITVLQGRGKGIYDLTPTAYEATSVQPYGERSVTIDMPYQDDPSIGQGLADFLLNRYETLTDQVTSLQLSANHSDVLMTQVLAREPGDRITITESVTGMTAVDAMINHVELVIKPGSIISCRWGLAPASVGDIWILGDADASLLGTSTVLGYA